MSPGEVTANRRTIRRRRAQVLFERFRFPPRFVPLGTRLIPMVDVLERLKSFKHAQFLLGESWI